MPKFVSSTSGHIYAHDKLAKAKEEEEDDIANLIEAGHTSDSSKKPSAINKKGTKEKQKNSLDLFKEELQRLQMERDEKRNKMRKNMNQTIPLVSPPQEISINQIYLPPPVPFPLVQDSICLPTPLLHVNPSLFCGAFINDYDPSVAATPSTNMGIMQSGTKNIEHCNNHVRYKPRSGFKSSDYKERQVKTDEASRSKRSSLSESKKVWLLELLHNLDPTKAKVGDAMMFCINHSDAAQEIIDTIYKSILVLDSQFHQKLAQVFLISDILHNCSAAVTNASFYRKGFQSKLVSIFEHLRVYLISLTELHKADKFKQKTLAVLGAWKEWSLYEDEFVIRLSNILLGLHSQTDADSVNHEANSNKSGENDIDGIELDDETLSRCLEAKGLSARWYRTLELSEDEESAEQNYV